MLNQPGAKRLIARLIRHVPLRLYRALLWLTQARFLVGVTAFVFDPAGQVLLLHHVFHPHYAWGPPGGWLEHGENPVAAIAREVREETGLTIQVHRPLYVQHKDGHLEIIYLATTDGGPLQLSGEILDAAFFDPRALPHRLRLYHEKVLPWAVAALAEETATAAAQSARS